MPPLSPAARLLGFAGLLPQFAAVGLMLAGRRSGHDMASALVVVGYFAALAYGALILSFLGGIWWGYAVRRAGRQGRLLVLSVVPSLVAFGAVFVAAAGLSGAFSGWLAVGLGSAIMLTLPVDRHLAATGEAPAGWMRLRVPLSLGLGALTILAGVIGTW